MMMMMNSLQLLQYHMVTARNWTTALNDTNRNQTRTPEGVLLPTALAGAAPLRVNTDAATQMALIGPSDDPSNKVRLTVSDIMGIVGAGKNFALFTVGTVLVPASLRAKSG
jgi:hypothetical protein